MTAAHRLSHFLLKAFVNRVRRRICIHMVRFRRSTCADLRFVGVAYDDFWDHTERSSTAVVRCPVFSEALGSPCDPAILWHVMAGISLRFTAESAIL